MCPYEGLVAIMRLQLNKIMGFLVPRVTDERNTFPPLQGFLRTAGGLGNQTALQLTRAGLPRN
jgi:hypothetical protein